VPAQAELSDVVYVIAGAPVPYLLRRKGDYYLLIGKYFVHSIMCGEAVEGVELSSMKTLTLG